MSNPAPSRPVNLTLFPSLAFLLFGVALALGFVTATDKFSRSLTQMRQNRPEIVVKGVAAQDIRSAQGMVACALTWRGEDFEVGRKALAAQRAKLDELLRELGFQASELIYAAPTVHRLEPAVYVEPPVDATDKTPIRRPQLIDYTSFARGKNPEFIIEQDITAQTAEVERILALTRREIFLTDNVTLRRSAPIFRLLDLAAVKKDLLESAAKDAQRRASTMVANSGTTLGALLEASQGQIQISAKDRIDESDSSQVDVRSIDKTIRVVVTMRFELIRE
jgi:hypothetical protein